MQPPVVRDLNATVQQIGSSVAPMKDQINADITANDAYGKAQVAGLDAKQKTAFGNIEQAAQDKNMYFSGFSPEMQAQYTADTYLPALASLQNTIAQTRSGLLKEKIGLDMNVFDKAWNSVEDDRKVLADWNKMTAEQQFQASEADKQRVFQAQQSEKDRALTMSEGAANRASSQSIAATRSGGGGGSAANPTGSISAFLNGKTGKDGKVSPSTCQAGREQWVAAGGSPDDYNATFSGLINGSHWQDYLGGWK